MAPDSHSPEYPRPTGRMRLAAALGGASVLAVGLGSGVIQAQSDGAQTGAPGENALATAQQPSADTATAEAEAPNPNVSSTPLDPPAPVGEGATDAVAAAPAAKEPPTGGAAK